MPKTIITENNKETNGISELNVTMTKINTQKENEYLIHLINNTAVLETLGPLIKPRYFQSRYGGILASIILDFHQKYKKSPGMDITLFYDSEVKGKKNYTYSAAEEWLLDNYLNHLSKTAEGFTEFSSDVIIDRCYDWICQRDLELHQEEINLLKDNKKFVEAADLAEKYRKPALSKAKHTLEDALTKPELKLVLPFNEFVELPKPKRRFLIYPWLMEQDTVLIVGAPGIGKSFFGLEVARTASQADWGMGGLWDANDSWVNTLYIDGELPQDELSERAKALGVGGNCTLISKMRLGAADIPFNLANENDRRDLTKAIMKGNGIIPFELVILDNLFSLLEGVDLKDDVAWGAINSWLMRLRAKNVTVLMEHHPTKKGDQFGSIVKTFNITTSLLLKKAQVEGKDNAKFSIIVDKGRNMGLGLAGRTYELLNNEWIVEEYTSKELKKQDEEELLAKVAAALVAGKSQSDIGNQIKIDKSTVSRRKDKLVSHGYIISKDGVYSYTSKGEEWISQWMY